jgi:hypothetical protein
MEPEGPNGTEDPVLTVKVYNDTGKTSHEEVEYSPSKKITITDVRTHIQVYGCLITAYTMLLRDQGENVYVTDFYKAIYRRVMGKDFDQEAQSGGIVLPNMLSHVDDVQTVAPNYRGIPGTLTGTRDDEIRQSLQDELRAHGPVVLHVANNHWIVVDRYNEDGTFNVRDPLHGERLNVTIGTDHDKTYRFADDREIRYVEPVRRRGD